MGLHQDKDESAPSIAAGLPVVSISLGDTARFLFGGLRRKDPVESRLLESGDAFVFGGPARLRYHGVSRIVPGTAPPELELAGRFNLTFRQILIAIAGVVQAFRPARHGGPEGPHYIQLENAPKASISAVPECIRRTRT